LYALGRTEVLGLLAYSSQSLIPGMIGHAAMDVFNFSYWWWSLIGRYDRQPVFETGIDGAKWHTVAHFWPFRAVAVAKSACFPANCATGVAPM
jgi:hypothetical protein